MIEFKRACAIGDRIFPDLPSAQKAALVDILRKGINPEDTAEPEWEGFVQALLAHADQVVNILTLTERSLPKARAANGGRKPRKPKATAQPEELNLKPAAL